MVVASWSGTLLFLFQITPPCFKGKNEDVFELMETDTDVHEAKQL